MSGGTFDRDPYVHELQDELDDADVLNRVVAQLPGGERRRITGVISFDGPSRQTVIYLADAVPDFPPPPTRRDRAIRVARAVALVVFAIALLVGLAIGLAAQPVPAP